MRFSAPPLEALRNLVQVSLATRLSEEDEMLARFLILVALLSLFSSCSNQKQIPFRIVQICLPNPDDTTRLVTMLKATAAIKGMTFIDNTARARKGLAVTAQSQAQRDEAKWVISLIVQGSDGLGATATNLGLAPSEVAIGFTAGRSNDVAQAFADHLTEKIASRWKVVPVLKEQAAEKGACA
jgi:hypothetical protein